MIYFLVAFFVSILIAWLIIHTEHLHYSFTHDNDLSAVQKFHEEPVPRIGGVGIALAVCTTLYFYGMDHEKERRILLWLVISTIPVFFGGLIEDLTKKVSPLIRLCLAFISSAIAFFKLNASFTRTGIDWIDQTILEILPISLFLTIIIIGGVSNATNIIDGFNGLLLGYAMLVFGSMVWISFQCDDQLLYTINLVIIGGILGLFLFNFPKGSIFTGDGGAYLIGFLLIVNSLLLVNRNNIVSPLFPFLILIYPIYETLFSIYRKQFLRKMSPLKPDAIHFHMLIHNRVVPQSGNIAKIHHNPFTSIIIWCISFVSILPSIFWWENSYVLLIAILAYCLVYTLIYLRIVRFG